MRVAKALVSLYAQTRLSIRRSIMAHVICIVRLSVTPSDGSHSHKFRSTRPQQKVYTIER